MSPAPAEDFTVLLGPVLLTVHQARAMQHGALHRQSGIPSSLLDQVQSLIIEGRPPDRPVALVDGADFHRETDEHAIEAAYEQEQRTRVYEHIGYSGVLLPVIARLSELAGGKVACSAYRSQTGDTSIGPHHDDWLGVILQVDGAKEWRIWGPEGIRTLTTRKGDILAIPKGVQHDVSTPHDPGRSLHVTLALMGDAA